MVLEFADLPDLPNLHESVWKFFEKINQSINVDKVEYDVVTDFWKLMEVVGQKAL